MTGNVWKFAVDVYAQPGVETACLALQEQGADVCLLLVAAWLGRRGVSCSKERAQILENAARPWRETVIEPCADCVAPGAKRQPTTPAWPNSARK